MRTLPILAATTALTLALAGCGSGAPKKATATVTPAPSTLAPARLDSYARLMCEQLDEAVRARAAGGEGAELKERLAEVRATTSALQSTTPEVVEMMRGYDATVELGRADRLRPWCTEHWTPAGQPAQ